MTPEFLVTEGIDSLSLNPDSQLKTMLAIVKLEQALARNRSGEARDQLQTPAPPTPTSMGVIASETAR